MSSTVITLALPLVAATRLDASALEMGLLGTMATLPNLVVGLFAGTWADRARRRPTLIAAHVGRALLLASIPVALALGTMTIQQLYAALFLFGTLTTFFDVAQAAYLPLLVGRARLLAANSRLAASTSAATALGPGLAGALIGLVGAPLALLADAAVLLAAAALVGRIRVPEPRPEPARRPVRTAVAAGLRLLYAHPLLRSVAGSSMLYLFFGSVMLAVYVLYATREVGMSPAALGAVYGVGGVGAVVGAGLAVRITRRLGLGRTMIGANLVGGLSVLLVPLAAGAASPAAALGLLGLAQGGSQFMGAVFYVNQTSLVQGAAPAYLLGRVVAGHRFLTLGVMPVGSLLGGVLGQAVGLRATLAVGALGMLLPTVWLWLSPLRSVHDPAYDTRAGPAS